MFYTVRSMNLIHWPQNLLYIAAKLFFAVSPSKSLYLSKPVKHL